MKKVICFIDGFNIYHAIDELNQDPKTRKKVASQQHLKWLNLHSLASAFVPPSSQELTEVFYFSAYATWMADPYARHRAYVAALKSTGIHDVMGHFKNKDKSCNRCQASWVAHEEKESDVNLAIHLVEAAYQNRFDRALIMTADTDIVPAIKAVRKAFPDKIVDAVIPERRYRFASEMKQVCSNVIQIREHHFQNNLFPEEVRDAEGNLIATRPAKYAPPARKK